VTAFFLARGAGADAGGAGLFGMTRSCSFARHHRAVGRLRSPANPEWELLSSSAGAGQYRPCMGGMEGGSAAGTSPATLYAEPALAAAGRAWGRATQRRGSTLRITSCSAAEWLSALDGGPGGSDAGVAVRDAGSESVSDELKVSAWLRTLCTWIICSNVGSSWLEDSVWLAWFRSVQERLR